MNSNVKVTRGWGLLEGLLAKLRSQKANSFISQTYRKGRILDIGCGSYPYFLINTDFNEKYGLDSSLKTLKVKNLNLKKNDVTKQKLPFNDSFFDAVTMLAVLEHIEYGRLKFVLSEIRRVLKNEGILIITTPAPWADKLLHQMAKVGLISSEEIHEHKHNHPRKKIEDIIESGGFNRGNIKSGFFELHMNMWFIAKK